MPPSRPLSGVRVLDLTQLTAGPFATLLLADAGADVVKVERPGEGELGRGLRPIVEGPGGDTVSAQILRLGRNRRGIAIDLKHAEGRQVFRSLVAVADVVCENYTPGTLDRLNLGWNDLRELNPRLIYAAVSGFGHGDDDASPLSRRPAFDLTAQAYSGMLDITGPAGGPPVPVGVPIGDLAPGAFLAIGVLLALRQRDRTGVGRKVDVSMLDVLALLCERPASIAEAGGRAPLRGGPTFPQPYGVYRAGDGWVAISASQSPDWERLCTAIGRPDLLDDQRLATASGRADHHGDIIEPAISQWTRTRDRATAVEALAAAGVAAAPVQDVLEMMASTHIASRHMVLEMEHPVAGRFRVMGNPIKISGVPEPEVRPAPAVGEHTSEVLHDWLGYDAAAVAALAASGAVG
jgi:formyl-CoA transferase